MSLSKAKVLVLNVDRTPLGVTSWQRAVTLVASGKAETLVESDVQIHPSMKLPVAIRLIKAIRNLWKTQVPWSKHSVHIRDGYVCRYCGAKLNERTATIDHVIPRDRGGKNSWTNTICSCFDCNNKKGNRTPSEAGMSIIGGLPYTPTIMEFILKEVRAKGLDKVLEELGV